MLAVLSACGGQSWERQRATGGQPDAGVDASVTGRPGAAGGTGAGGGDGAGSDGTGATAGATGLSEVELVNDYAACAGQRALVPASGEVMQTYASTREETMRTETSTYVSYQQHSGGLWLYVSFAPGLPAVISTEEAVAAYRYAYVEFEYPEPPDVGGSLTLLNPSDRLNRDDFDRFEVVEGRMEWRLAWTSTSYWKELSRYDDDPTNDPGGDPGDCVIGDVGGRCLCSFRGPAIDVTLEGSFPL